MATKTEIKFKPEEHLTNIKGKPYLQVMWRLVWFREDHPDWGIETEVVVKAETKSAIAKATIKDKDGRIIAVAHKTEDAQGFGDYAEKAETGATGRALAMCGYGTQFSPELDEFETKTGEPRIVDSLVESKVKLFQENKPISLRQRTAIVAIANQIGDKEMLNFGATKDWTMAQASAYISSKGTGGYRKEVEEQEEQEDIPAEDIKI